ncbi:HAD family hydrolase [Solihabitans fulvus]|uniref:HAD family hydrolase n=1 Tax=Solihabitans fulvus TaxID=1892852 RepID=A0A5B2XAD7_9PSEU|nr:HAD family hydrolase [Solihabitans fulvus]KAA2260648.1 HAD family hydrolase [Solihabitans fulvus]
MLLLDFDGVVCDALLECALVTWFGLHVVPEFDVVSVAVEALARLPEDFVRAFRTVRDYSRTLDRFVVAHLAEAAAIGDQARFDELFARLPPELVARFVAGAGAVRSALRSRQPEFWLGLHTLYPGMPELLRRHAGKVAIVTAKDAGSVADILAHHGLADAVAHIEGECGDKAAAVSRICAEFLVEPAAAVFVDDNLANVLRVRETGARTRWALWGYHTAEHVAIAARERVVGIDRPSLIDCGTPR